MQIKVNYDFKSTKRKVFYVQMINSNERHGALFGGWASEVGFVLNEVGSKREG